MFKNFFLIMPFRK